jgi:hypothetical protein
MSFDPKKHMMKLSGKDYLPVAPRRVWALELHPDWRIETEELYADEVEGVYRFKAYVKDGDGHIVATGHGSETRKGFAAGPYEKAETVAIGRALALAGIGTLEAQELAEDGTGKIADAPQAAKPAGTPAPKPTQDEEPALDMAAEHGAPSSVTSPKVCFDCGAGLSIGQATVSIQKFGEAYCLLHQKDHERLGA